MKQSLQVCHEAFSGPTHYMPCIPSSYSNPALGQSSNLLGISTLSKVPDQSGFQGCTLGSSKLNRSELASE
jgi:hypothetical protein